MSLPKRKHVPLVQRVWFSVEQVAEAAGIVFTKGDRKGEVNVQMARRILVKAGAARKRGRWWYATHDLLRRAFPDEADRIIAALED